MLNLYLLRTRYPHWGEYSGIHQFAKHLDPQQCAVQMHVVPDNDEDFPTKNQVVQSTVRKWVQRRGMDWYKLSDLVAEWNALKTCWTSSVDIIHFLDGEHTAQFLPQLVRLLPQQRPKLIATYHQPPDLLDTLIDRQVIAQLDAITVVSPEQATYFNQFIDPDRVHLILHGIDTDYFRPTELHKQDDRYRCLTVGKYLRDFRALRQVAEMLMHRQDIEFHVVSSDAAEVQELPNVTIHQGIDDAALLKLYQQSDILFLPLIQSTANNALLEGLACGLPIVTTDLNAVKAYVSGKESILIDGNVPSLFAEAIIHLIDDAVERQRMRQEARQRAMALSWPPIASIYQKIYLQL